MLVQETFIYAAVSGGAGGLAFFLLGLRRGHYRNNKYFSKVSIEVFGAAITALFLASILVPSNNYKIIAAVAFAIGVAWSEILQTLRIKITEIVEVALRDARGKSKGNNEDQRNDQSSNDQSSNDQSSNDQSSNDGK